MGRVDKRKFLNDVKASMKEELVHLDFESNANVVAFQADDEGSIPFSRSIQLKGLARLVATSRRQRPGSSHR
jgi:hypothetical protein